MTGRRVPAAVESLLREYRSHTPGSAALHRSMRRTLAAGETRVVTFYEPYPVAVREAQGARVVDVDGATYVDLVNNMGSLIHGHRFPPVLAALSDAMAELGTAQAAPNRPLNDFAAALVERFPAFERVRILNSGSEAAILAARIARRVTGRRRLVTCVGAYHGMGEDFAPDAADTVRLPYNEPSAVEQVIDDSIAAVFVEPFLGHAGAIPADPGFLQAVEAWARRRGALFVLDEVQSMRNDFRAYHGLTGLRPDLVMMGKAVAGGIPVGLLGGRRELVEVAAFGHPDGLKHSGTFNGNVLTCAAGCACLEHLSRGAIGRLNQRSAELAASIPGLAERAGHTVSVTRSGSTMAIHFRPEAPRDAVQAAERPAAAALLHIAALLEGLAVVPGGRLILSTALSDGDMVAIERSLETAFSRLAPLASGS